MLLPWAEVDPAATLPDGTRVVDLAAAWVPGDDLVARRDDVALVVAS